MATKLPNPPAFHYELVSGSIQGTKTNWKLIQISTSTYCLAIYSPGGNCGHGFTCKKADVVKKVDSLLRDYDPRFVKKNTEVRIEKENKQASMAVLNAKLKAIEFKAKLERFKNETQNHKLG